jgi:hypothetical protein
MDIGTILIIGVVGLAIFFGVPLLMSGGSMENLNRMATTNNDPVNVHLVMTCNLNSFELNARNNDKKYVEYVGKVYLMKDGKIVWKSSDRRNYSLEYTLDFKTQSQIYEDLGLTWFTIGSIEGDRIHLTFGTRAGLDQFLRNIREVYGDK